MLNVQYSKRVRNFSDDCIKFANDSHSFESVFAALQLYRSFACKFDESVDMTILLGVDPKRTDQVVKTSTILPSGTGKKPKILVFAEGEMANISKDLGAIIVGSDDVIEKIIQGSIVPGKDFTSCVATLDVMPKLSKSKAVQILGRAGVMPNAKIGTVAKDITPVVKELLAGRVELRPDKFSTIQLSVGRMSFTNEAILANILSVFSAVKNARPSGFKGNLFKSVRISTTMMPVSLSIKMSELYAKS